MSGIFSRPKMPSTPAPVETPTVDEAKIQAQEEERAANKRGKRMNILAGFSRTSSGASKLGD